MTPKARTFVKRTRSAMKAARAAGWDGTIETWETFQKEHPPEGWPFPDGTLNLKGDNARSGGPRTASGAKGSRRSSSPLLPRSLHARLRTTSESQSSRSSQSWRSLKSSDVTSFNAGAEAHFVLWLTARINAAEFRAVSIGWVYSNAAYELDISVETVKRYLMKHTADLAEFHSDGKVITVRD